MAREKEGFKLFSFYIKKESLEKIRSQAKQEERTISNIINRCIDEGFVTIEKNKNA